MSTLRRRPCAAALLLAMSTPALAEASQSADPAPDRRLAGLADSFVALCVEGRPTLAESARRAQAAGWDPVGGSDDMEDLPEERRPVVMQRPDMIFLLFPSPRPGDGSMCEVGVNLPRIIPLDELASSLSARLRLGPHSVERFGDRDSAVWRPDDGLTLRASVPSGGPRTHIFMAVQPATASGQ